MKQSNALRKPYVTSSQIGGLIAQREALQAMKKRLQLLEDSVTATEQEILSQLDKGPTLMPDTPCK